MQVAHITPLGLRRDSIKSMLSARKDARRDMQSVMPFIRHMAAKAYVTLNLRIAAELMTGARGRK